jgi:phenylpropionate dioxygenase-like ring-hydroxylating dioxygenase large terminal subunit
VREYWTPALLTTELPTSDSDPVRLLLLGERLIAFRDTSGKAGVVANSCPHRGASLFFARNENQGLRCVYHGWKFDVRGTCVDMPNEPAESDFKSKVRVTAYPTQERNGLIWVYMGPRLDPPPLPDLEPNMVEGGHVGAWLRSCNWMQALEGDIDTVHLGFLHVGSVQPEDMVPGTFSYYVVKDRSPRYSVVDVDGGVMYGTYRPAHDNLDYWRIGQFLFPF